MKIIAETASNHMGEMDYLKELSLQSINNGADFVTVQVFDLDSFVTREDKPSYSNFSKICFDKKQWKEYFKWAETKDISVIPCILDNKAFEMVSSTKINTVKVHASDILNLNFLQAVDSHFSKVFLEFGGATLEEIGEAVKVFQNSELVLVYGFNDYPTKIENQNLNFISTLRNIFDVKVGFADHSDYTEEIGLMAMAAGAEYFEKHVTLDKKNDNRFDWEVSIEPSDLLQLSNKKKQFKPALGLPLRDISQNERKFRKLIYKKIVAKQNIDKDSEIRLEYLEFKRAVEGIEIDQLNTIVKKRTKVYINKNSIIMPKHISNE